jgi:hypothetical protein
LRFWGSDGVAFRDFDRDGFKEIISYLRVTYPEDLSKMTRNEDFTMMFRFSIYKLKETKFIKLGDYYTVHEPPYFFDPDN